MDPEDYGSEAEEEQEEATQLQPGKDYEALDPETGFKAIERQIWEAFDTAWLKVPVDDREGEPSDWAETFAEEQNLDKNRVLTVVTLGIYAGDRDEFNQRTGEGKTIYSNGDTYAGQYWAGKRNGKGKYIFVSKGKGEVPRLIEDAWKKRNPDATDFVTRVAQYLDIGEHIVQMGIDHGFYPVYNGMYANDMRHGEGIMINQDGSVYEGLWMNNLRHGAGVYHYINGDTYSGEWIGGRKNGMGCYTFCKNKGQYIGKWENDKIVEGEWRMPNGVYYQGKFDGKNQPGDVDAGIVFPHLNMVMKGEFVAQQWTPNKELLTTEQYQKMLQDRESSLEGEDGAVGGDQ